MAIFVFLSILHIYWALGGQWYATKVIPLNEDNQPIFMPGKIATFIVAFGLMVFASLVLIQVTSLKWPIGHTLAYKYGLWLIIIIFLLRFIGDFKYVGVFRKIKNSSFGSNDTRYYTPLCLFIFLLALLLELFK